MSNLPGKLFLTSIAGLVIWRSMTDSTKEKVLRGLEGLAAASYKDALIRQAQQPTLPPLQPMALESVQPIDETTWNDIVEDFKRNLLTALEPPRDKSIDTAPKAEKDAYWRNVVVHPSVVLIVGRRGSGKSALGYRLLELLRFGLTPYVVGAPSLARKFLPDWIGIAPSLEDIPPKSVALIDEAYIHYHARRSMAHDNMNMSRLLNLSRQRKQTMVFLAQESRQVDRSLVSSANVVVFKEMGMLQPEFERRELRSIVAKAQEALASIRGNKRRWSYVYSPDADFMGILENSLPSFWKPGLSRLFAVESDQATLKIPKSTTPTEKAAKAKDMRSQGASYSVIARALGVSRSTVVNCLKGYPYK